MEVSISDFLKNEMVLVKLPKDMVEVEQLSAKKVSFVWKLHYYNCIILESVDPSLLFQNLRSVVAQVAIDHAPDHTLFRILFINSLSTLVWS